MHISQSVHTGWGPVLLKTSEQWKTGKVLQCSSVLWKPEGFGLPLLLHIFEAEEMAALIKRWPEFTELGQAWHTLQRLCDSSKFSIITNDKAEETQRFKA